MRNPVLLFLFVITLTCCKKDGQYPTIELKSGAGYTSTDITVAPGSQFLVGFNAYKTTDKLNLFYTEVSYDGANTATLVSRTYTSENEKDHFSRDVTVTVRNQVGVERWIFNINDDGGRISKKELRISVQ